MGAYCLKEITREEAQKKLLFHILNDASDNDLGHLINDIFMDKEVIHYEVL